MRLAPLLELAHQAEELLGGGGSTHVPHVAMQIVVLAAAVANLQEAMQEAPHHGDRGKQRLEGVLSRRPAVGVDGFGGVVRVQLAGLDRNVCVGRLQSRIVRCLCQGESQHTAFGSGHGGVSLRAAPIDMLLIGREMFGPPRGMAHGRPH